LSLFVLRRQSERSEESPHFAFAPHLPLFVLPQLHQTLVISTGGGAFAAVAEKPASLPMTSLNQNLVFAVVLLLRQQKILSSTQTT